MKLIVAVLLSILAVCPSMAQQTDSSDRVLFEQFYVSTIDRLKHMYISKRGASLEGCDLPYGYNYGDGYFLQKLKSELIGNRGQSRRGFILYHYQGDTLYSFLISRNSFSHAYRKISSEKMDLWGRSLRQAIGVDDFQQTASGDHLNASNKKGSGTRGENIRVAATSGLTKERYMEAFIDSISQILFPEEHRAGLSGISHLIIQPQHSIGLIPFCLLKPFGDNVMLIDSMSYSFSPHACNFQEFAEGWGNDYLENDELTCLLVGNPDFVRNRYHLQPLPGAEAEVQAVGSMIEKKLLHLCHSHADSARLHDMCTPLTGENATYSKVIENSEKVDILYLATHGYFDFEKLLENSFIALAPDEKSGTGFWTASEIQQMALNNDLVILSACQTGVGSVYAGGFIQIGRSFFIAGAKNVVCSLWSVEDMATQKLMTIFMGNIMDAYNKHGKAALYYPAQYLRKAMLEMRALHPEPSKWASFCVYGFSFRD